MTVTAIAVLGGTGVLPSTAGEAASAEATPALRQLAAPKGGTSPDERAGSAASPDRHVARVDPRLDMTLPTASGSGRRVVFSQSRQRVWLVAGGGAVRRTYLVSGSIYDNLDPGTYSVFSRSGQAWGIDDSGAMKYFVRFAHGDNAAIGFHDIPVSDGRPVQRVADLGTPESHGCIRQRRADAIALWRFAPLGTTVVVTA